MTNIDVMLGKGIADQRRSVGLSQQELAQKLGISASTLIAFEEGSRRAEAGQLFTIAEILNLDIAGQIGGPSDEPFATASGGSHFGTDVDEILAHYEALSPSHRSAIYAFLVAAQPNFRRRPS